MEDVGDCAAKFRTRNYEDSRWEVLTHQDLFRHTQREAFKHDRGDVSIHHASLSSEGAASHKATQYAQEMLEFSTSLRICLNLL